jgi:Maltose acetyltransferase
MSGPDRRTEKQKMLAGDLYRAVGDELAADNLRADRLTRAYNATGADEAERRAALLRDLLGPWARAWLSVRSFAATTATTSAWGAACS